MAPSVRGESAGAPASPGPEEPGEGEGNHRSERSAGKDGEEEEGEDGRVTPDPAEKLVMEFSCGLEAKGGELGGGSVCTRGGGGASELHQYNGVTEEGGSANGLDCFLKPKVPAVSVMDRLTELHGSEALSFSSALAAQVAARSQSLINMEEQTFGDDEDAEEQESD